LFSVLTVSLLLYSLYNYYRNPFPFSRRDLLCFVAVSALFWIYSLSLIWSADIINGLLFLKSQAFLLLIPLVVLFQKKLVAEHINRWINIYLAAICLAWLATLVAHFLPDDVMQTLTKNDKLFQPFSSYNTLLFGMYSPFITRIQFCNFLVVGFFMGLHNFIKNRSFYNLIIVGFLLSGLILLGGRGGLLAWFVACSFFFILYSSSLCSIVWKKLFISLGSIGLVLIVGYLLLFHVEPVRSRFAQHRYETELIRSGEFRKQDYSHFTTLRRFVSWENSLNLIQTHPILGTGIGDYAAAYQNIYDTDKYELPVNNHSEYFHIAGSTGIVGLGLFAVSLLLFFYLLYDLPRLPDRAIAYSCILVFIVAFIPDALLLKQVDLSHFALILSFWLWSKP